VVASREERFGGGVPSQQLPDDEQCRSGTPLGRLPSQPIFKLLMWEGSSAGPLLERSHKEPTQRLCKGEVIPKVSKLRAGSPLRDEPLVVEEDYPRGWMPRDRVAWAFCGPILVSSTGDAGCSENVPGKSKC